MIKDLLQISFSAQSQYIMDKMEPGKDLDTFEFACNQLLHSLLKKEPVNVLAYNAYLKKTNSGKIAIDLYKETYRNLRDRFVDGHSGDFYLEKIL